MSHELASTVDGRIAMAYTGATPWHGLGQSLPADADLPTWEQAAGFDFRIQRSKVRYFADRDGSTQLEMPDRLVLFRNDNKHALGIVSPRYHVVQPGEVLHFFADLIGAAGFAMESAGVLFEGAQYWALARITQDCTIVPNDRVGGFLLLHTASDGTGATTATFTTTRVVCNNTVRMALSEKDPGRVRLTHRTKFDADKVRDQLGVGREKFAQFCDAAKFLARLQVGAKQADSFLVNLLRDDNPANPIAPDAVKEIRDSKAFGRILALFDGKGDGSRLEGVRGTAWGLVNAVTQYVDRENSARTLDGKIASAWFGTGDALKSKAFALALAD